MRTRRYARAATVLTLVTGGTVAGLATSAAAAGLRGSGRRRVVLQRPLQRQLAERLPGFDLLHKQPDLLRHVVFLRLRLLANGSMPEEQAGDLLVVLHQ